MPNLKPKLYTPLERDRKEIEELLADPDPMVVYRAIIDAANYEGDWRWLQQRCLDLLKRSKDETVRIGAIHGIQFLIAVRGEIDPAAVIPALREAQKEPGLRLQAEDALNDLFYKFPSSRPI